MLTGQVKHYVEVWQHNAISALGNKVHLPSNVANVNRPHFRAFAKAVTRDRTSHQRQNFAYCSVVCAQNGCAVKRHAMQKLYKRLFQVFKVVPIGLHVVSINIGDHCHHGQQV